MHVGSLVQYVGVVNNQQQTNLSFGQQLNIVDKVNL